MNKEQSFKEKLKKLLDEYNAFLIFDKKKNELSVAVDSSETWMRPEDWINIDEFVGLASRRV